MGVGGCTQQIFIGRGPPLNLLYTIFLDIVYLLLTNVTPFTYLAQNFVSLLTAGKPHCPKIEINHKYRPLSRRVRVGPRGGASPYKYLLSTSPGFRAEAPRIGDHREYPPPGYSRKIITFPFKETYMHACSYSADPGFTEKTRETKIFI